eukprot:4823289-Pleurochrysis_carterae.AAC.1
MRALASTREHVPPRHRPRRRWTRRRPWTCGCTPRSTLAPGAASSNTHAHAHVMYKLPLILLRPRPLILNIGHPHEQNVPF